MICPLLLLSVCSFVCSLCGACNAVVCDICVLWCGVSGVVGVVSLFCVVFSVSELDGWCVNVFVSLCDGVVACFRLGCVCGCWFVWLLVCWCVWVVGLLYYDMLRYAMVCVPVVVVCVIVRVRALACV